MIEPTGSEIGTYDCTTANPTNDLVPRVKLEGFNGNVIEGVTSKRAQIKASSDF